MNEAREALGWSHEELSRRSGVPAANLRKYAAGEVDNPRGEVMANIARALGKAPMWLHSGIFKGDVSPETVPLKGYVGAGQQVFAVDAGDLEDVEAPADATVRTVAAQIRGDSMLPLRDGWLIYWSKMLPPFDCINTMCVCHLADGRIFVKLLMQGTTPQTFHLVSTNSATMTDEVVEWASPIDWIKPR